MNKYNRNPSYAKDNVEFTNMSEALNMHKDLFRLFYSLNSFNQTIRNTLIPNAMSLDKAIPLLQQYAKNNTLIIHHLILESINDSELEINCFVDEYNLYFKENELRVLRYNNCDANKKAYLTQFNILKESESFITKIEFLNTKIKNLKVQISPGSEVSAACGQFLVSKTKQI